MAPWQLSMEDKIPVLMERHGWRWDQAYRFLQTEAHIKAQRPGLRATNWIK